MCAQDTAFLGSKYATTNNRYTSLVINQTSRRVCRDGTKDLALYIPVRSVRRKGRTHRSCCIQDSIFPSGGVNMISVGAALVENLDSSVEYVHTDIGSILGIRRRNSKLYRKGTFFDFIFRQQTRKWNKETLFHLNIVLRLNKSFNTAGLIVSVKILGHLIIDVYLFGVLRISRIRQSRTVCISHCHVKNMICRRT